MSIFKSWHRSTGDGKNIKSLINYNPPNLSRSVSFASEENRKSVLIQCLNHVVPFLDEVKIRTVPVPFLMVEEEPATLVLPQHPTFQNRSNSDVQQ